MKSIEKTTKIERQIVEQCREECLERVFVEKSERQIIEKCGKEKSNC